MAGLGVAEPPQAKRGGRGGSATPTFFFSLFLGIFFLNVMGAFWE
jgi:hypothetical protein